MSSTVVCIVNRCCLSLTWFCSLREQNHVRNLPGLKSATQFYSVLCLRVYLGAKPCKRFTCKLKSATQFYSVSEWNSTEKFWIQLQSLWKLLCWNNWKTIQTNIFLWHNLFFYNSLPNKTLVSKIRYDFFLQFLYWVKQSCRFRDHARKWKTMKHLWKFVQKCIFM